jgi:hypothetical protein
MPEPPEASYWDYLEPIWKSVDIHRGPKRFLEQFSKLPPVLGDLYAAHWLVSEVEDGAFPQFFSNSTGVLAPEAAAALEHLQLHEAATIVKRAMAFFGEPYPRERNARKATIDCVWDKPRSPEADELLSSMLELSIDFSQAIGGEGGPFETAADAYALRVASPK